MTPEQQLALLQNRDLNIASEYERLEAEWDEIQKASKSLSRQLSKDWKCVDPSEIAGLSARYSTFEKSLKDIQKRWRATTVQLRFAENEIADIKRLEEWNAMAPEERAAIEQGVKEFLARQ